GAKVAIIPIDGEILGSRDTIDALHRYAKMIVGKLDGKVALITAGSTGLALADAKLFVEEGAYVFITGRRQESLSLGVTELPA
ncbi:MAG: hypothetical protein ACJ736_28410, partial [Streptomyces sp.]